MPEAIRLKLCGHWGVVQHSVVAFLGFGRWYVADGREEPAIVEPVDPFERGVFNGLEGSPRTSSVDHLGLVKAVDRLGQGVVVAVAHAAYRRLDPGFGKALGRLDRDVLAAAVAVVDQATTMDGAAPPL